MAASPRPPRRVLAVTGTRSDYGLMTPVYRRIAESGTLALDLVVTGMHHLPAFASSLEQVRRDALGRLHERPCPPEDDSPKAMASALGAMVSGIASSIADARPDLLLLQGDRGEMLAAAIAAAHMNLPIVHMSGGDRTGSIDDSIRHAISTFAHLHLTTCRSSSETLESRGESPARIFEVGEPGLDLIREFVPEPREALLRELDLDPGRPFLLATLHPVTTEVEAAPAQMAAFLDALEQLGMQAVVTYPNADTGGRRMAEGLESRRGRPWLRIAPNLGSQRYLSLLACAAAIVGNSSSGIFESPSFRIPAVNVGTRQHGRLRASNVLDTGHGTDEIVAAVRRALSDQGFRAGLAACSNPYGDGHAAERTVDILGRLRLEPALLTKWIALDPSRPLLEPRA